MKFLVPNYSCLQSPWLRGYHPQIPVLSVLCPQLNLLNPPEKNSWLRHWPRYSKRSVSFRSPQQTLYAPLLCHLPRLSCSVIWWPEWRSILILSSILHLGLPIGLFPSGFPTKPCVKLCCPPYVLHDPPIFFCDQTIRIFCAECRSWSFSLGIFLHSLTSEIAAVSSNDIRGTKLLCAILLKAIQAGYLSAILRKRCELLFFVVVPRVFLVW